MAVATHREPCSHTPTFHHHLAPRFADDGPKDPNSGFGSAAEKEEWIAERRADDQKHDERFGYELHTDTSVRGGGEGGGRGGGGGHCCYHHHRPSPPRRLFGHHHPPHHLYPITLPRTLVQAPRLGWLFNWVTHTLQDTASDREIAAVELFFLEQDGSTFKSVVVHQPYFYLGLSDGR